MKILHLALLAPYNEGWGYQENLLTKYQAQMGHDVTLVTTCMKNSTTSQIEFCNPEEYLSPDGFRVIRLQRKKSCLQKVLNLLCIYDIYELIKTLAPDFIMIHGLNSFSALQVKKYVRRVNRNCVVVADNHADENNAPILCRRTAKDKVIMWLWRWLNSRMRNCYAKVYGVSPKRAEIAASAFGVPSSLIDVLPAGADDDKVNFIEKESIRRSIREKHNISVTDFLIVTGGKIDEKKNIDAVMEAIGRIDRDDVKLIVFGDCSVSLREKINMLAQHKSIRYIGWIPADKTYHYFLAADLIAFPGLHSVMWEQACATKTPCVYRKLDGFDHFDVGGNCAFLQEASVSALTKMLEDLIFTKKYAEMKQAAESEKTNAFLYSNIAVKALEMAKNRDEKR